MHNYGVAFAILSEQFMGAEVIRHVIVDSPYIYKACVGSNIENMKGSLLMECSCLE